MIARNTNMSTEKNEVSTDDGGNKEKCELQEKVLNNDDEEGGELKSSPSKFKINTYATTKSLIAGVMDIALLTSTASQIKLIAEAKATSWTAFNISAVTLLSISILLQMVLVVLVVIMATSKVELEENKREHEDGKRRMDRINKAVLVISVIITFINVLTGVFADKTSPVA